MSFSPSDPQLLNDCLSYTERHAVNHCSLNLLELRHYWNSLRESGLFQRILYDDQNADYQLAITTGFYSEEGWRDIAMSYLSGLTFTLYPIHTEHLVKAEVTLLWRGRELQSYTYELPFDRRVRLYYPGDDSGEFVDELVSLFLSDAERDRVFSSQYLYKTLGASDYSGGAARWNALDEFQLEKHELAYSPYEGLRLAYERKAEKKGEFEVRVYPVPRTEWSNLEQALLDEEIRIRQSQAHTVLEQLLGEISYADSVFVLFSDVQKNPIKGLQFRGEIRTSLGQRLYRDTFLFMREDKFVQVRVTCPDAACLEASRPFAREAVLRLPVPGESRFMAELRHKHRRISLRGE